MKKHNIILIGFMGAGKTSVGQKLAARMGTTLIDTDQIIESQEKMSISRLFETRGEEVFRSLETEVLKKLLVEAENQVISVGGGLPLKEENRVLLRELGLVCYLQVKPETVVKRLAGDTVRPLLQGENVSQRVETLLNSREPVYLEAAHETVRVDDQTLDEIAEEIMRRAEKGEQQR